MRINVRGKTIDLTEVKMNFAEGRALEKITGKSFFKLAEENFLGSLTDIQGLIYVVFKRSEPTLRFADLDEWDLTEIEATEDEQGPADQPVAGQEDGQDPTDATAPTGPVATSTPEESATPL